MTKHSGYMDRAMKAQDPRFARVLGKLGYARRDMTARKTDEIDVLRDEYRAAYGKKAFHGWDAETLREKIAAANEE